MTFSHRGWFIALGMLGACGGRVVVDTSGGGGGAGGGDAAVLSACNKWCEVRTKQCPYVGSCTDHCLEHASYLGPCESEYEALLLCRADHPSFDPMDCDKYVVTCEAESDALVSCVYPAGPCGSGECVVGGPGTAAIECSIACGGVVYTSACGQKGSNSGFPMDCTCQIDGELIGTCQNVTANGSANLGCCSVYFAESQ
ncbi:MAG: hypothetical protein R3F14_24815 [Polyangiaceae bacterium]